MVWVQASSQGQHPAIHLQPSDTVVLDGTTQGRSSMGCRIFREQNTDTPVWVGF